jgi:hypothetical protein
MARLQEDEREMTIPFRPQLPFGRPDRFNQQEG